MPRVQEELRGDPLLIEPLPLPNIPTGHRQAPQIWGPPRMGQALPTDEAWNCMGGSCLPKLPLGGTRG